MSHDINSENSILNFWIGSTAIDSLRAMCIREDGSVSIPKNLMAELLECVRYSKNILKLYTIESEAYKNWLFMLLEVVYAEVFHSRCFKVGQKKDCKFRQLLDQLDALFPRVDSSAFLHIG
ncbi:hypothetical protein [Borrelia persica]|uniref:hypothetical protein n=1 Tax=Borrelia persica TaxID=44448 RepID=UPI0004638648|nr:hypothetical protein [Borrelia persica]